MSHDHSPSSGLARADTVMLSRFFEARGSVRLALSITKKRSDNHERMIRESRLAAKGIELGPPLDNRQAVLTGMPTLLPDGDLFQSGAKGGVPES